MASTYEIIAKMTLKADDFDKEMKSVVDTMSNVGNLYKQYVAGPIIDATSQWIDEIGSSEMVLAGLVEDFDGVKAGIQDMAASSTFSIAEVTEASLELARAGMTTREEMEDFASSAMELSLVTGQQLNGSIDSLIKTMNTFPESGMEVSEVAALMAVSANRSAQNMGDLDNALTYSMATAAGAGVELRAMNAALMEMADRGVKGSKAGTRLKNAMIEIQKNADLEPFAKYNDTGLDMIATMTAIGKHLNGLSTIQEKNAFINENFNTRAADAVRLLAGNYEDLADTYDQLNAEKVAEDFKKIGEDVRDSPAYQLSLLKDNFQDLGMVLVEALLPVLQLLALVVGGIVSLITSLDKNVLAFIMTLMVWYATKKMILTLLMFYDTFLKAHIVTTKAYTVGAKIVSFVNGLMATSFTILGLSIWWIILIVLVLVAVIILMVKYWESILPVLKIVAGAIWTLVKGLVKAILFVITIGLMPFLLAIWAILKGVDFLFGTNSAVAVEKIINFGLTGNFAAFAEGGIVDQPTMGLVGEAGPEAVIPLDKLDSVLGDSGGEQTVNVYLDGKKIAKATGKRLVKELNVTTGLTNR